VVHANLRTRLHYWGIELRPENDVTQKCGVNASVTLDPLLISEISKRKE